jgi:hypothetical protein
VPGWQEPPPQASPVVQMFPSLQGAVLFVYTQALEPLQLSSVQALPSLQSAPVLQQPTIGVCAQTLPLHESAVHALPSSHSEVKLQQPTIGVWAHVPVPMAGLSLVLHAVPFVSVPFSAGAVESAADGPEPSFRPQRPTRPVPVVN